MEHRSQCLHPDSCPRSVHTHETGMAFLVANVNHDADPIATHVKASRTVSALSSKMDRLMTPPLMVLVTRAPTSTAPANSQIPAAIIACRKVNDRDDTDVAKEFATSLAPIPYCRGITEVVSLTNSTCSPAAYYTTHSIDERRNQREGEEVAILVPGHDCDWRLRRGWGKER